MGKVVRTQSERHTTQDLDWVLDTTTGQIRPDLRAEVSPYIEPDRVTDLEVLRGPQVKPVQAATEIFD